MDRILYNADVRLGVFAGGIGALLSLLVLMIILDRLAGVVTGARRHRREQQRADRLAAEPTIHHSNEQHWRKYL